MLKTVYKQLAHRLAQIDFAAIWPGFAPAGFALYEGNQCCLDGQLLPTPPEFRGNTAINYQGKPLAIWSIGEENDLDELAANFVHEMFHAFQLACGESRYPDDLALLLSPAVPQDLAARFTEGRYLARGDLEIFCALRRQRNALQECLAETIEGTAEYARLRALEQLSTEKFEAALCQKRRRLETPGPLALDPRRMAYYTGPLQLLEADRRGLDLRHNISREVRPLFSFLEAQVPPAPLPALEAEPQLTVLLAERNRKTGVRVARFLSKGPTCKRGRFRICGYDPMNQFAYGRQLFCTHFVLLRDPDHGQTLTLTGESLLDLSPGSFHEVQAVRTLDAAP